MRPTTRTRQLALLAGVAVLAVAACGSAGGAATTPTTDTSTDTSGAVAPVDASPEENPVTTRPRPSLFVDLPTIDLLAPAELDAGRAPTFEWSAIDAAATYRLSVLAPDAPTWAWLGSATSVRYGGVPEGTNGPSLRTGSWWSVTALADDGAVLAVSDLRAVSPTAERGPEPAWAGGPATEAATGEGSESDGTPSAPTADAASPAKPIGGRACDLLTVDEIHAAIEGDWNEPDLSSFGPAASWCEWPSVNGTLLSLSVGPTDNYDPDGWGADETLDALGERGYRVNHGWDRRIGFVHGEYSVMMTIDYTKVDPAGYLHLAQSIDDRLD
jgi:hypothetical protein